MLIPKKLKDKLRAFADEPAGARFQTRYHKTHARGGNVIVRKILFFGGGLLVTAIGIVMLPAPGPGMIVVAIGAGMVGQESLVVAKWLDWIEVEGRKAIRIIKKKWKESSQTTKLSAIVAVALSAAGFIYGSLMVYTVWQGG